MHGAVDGFSRTIIYLCCANNNRAQMVLIYFQQGVLEYGFPDYVRSDHGGENMDVWRYVIFNHNLDYSCAITGSSVHNERIERLWWECIGVYPAHMQIYFEAWKAVGILTL